MANIPKEVWVGLVILAVAIWINRSRKKKLPKVKIGTKNDLLEKAKETFGKYKSDLRVVGLVALGLIVFNTALYFLTKAAQPKIWDWYTESAGFFWAWNLSWLAVAFFASKRDDKDKPVPTAMLIKKAMLWLLVGAFVINLVFKEGGYRFAGQKAITTSSGNLIPAAMLGQEAPMEVALRAICESESGCKQFEDEDSKTPLKNKGNKAEGIEPSTASGKYQFTEAHRKKIEEMKLGFNLDTEEGQDAYARWLWTNDGKTKHWEGDPFGSYRWQTKLMSLGYGPWTTVEGRMTVKPGEEFDDREVVIYPGIYVDWSETTGAIEIKNQLGKTARHDPKSGVSESIPPPSTSIRFRSIDDKPIEVKLRFSRVPIHKVSCVHRRSLAPSIFISI